MKKLTLAEARQEIEDRETWLWRQKNWRRPHRRVSYEEGYDFDYELELTGYQAPGAAGDYWEIPNR